LNQTAVKKDPSKAMKVTEDFLTVVLLAVLPQRSSVKKDQYILIDVMICQTNW